MAYCAYPTKCDELENNWNPELQQYDFQCWSCRKRIVKPKLMVKGDPCNVALGAHWDGFNVTGKRSRGCWILNVIVLNARTSLDISLLPVLFISLGKMRTSIFNV